MLVSMPDQVLISSTQITPEWLTRVLVSSGALARGAVKTIEIDAHKRELSTSHRLRIAYSEDAQGLMPERLFLKTVDADQDEEFFGSSEVDYYLRDYVGLACAPLLGCYDGSYSAERRRYYLLLDDVSDSHVEVKTKTPTLAYGLVLAEALACLASALTLRLTGGVQQDAIEQALANIPNMPPETMEMIRCLLYTSPSPRD